MGDDMFGAYFDFKVAVREWIGEGTIIDRPILTDWCNPKDFPDDLQNEFELNGFDEMLCAKIEPETNFTLNGLYTDDYLKYFKQTYICHILYNALLRTYFFENDQHLKFPAVFNLEILDKETKDQNGYKVNCTTSISVCFNNQLFNRNFNQPSPAPKYRHPFSMILCKYDEQRKVQK